MKGGAIPRYFSRPIKKVLNLRELEEAKLTCDFLYEASVINANKDLTSETSLGEALKNIDFVLTDFFRVQSDLNKKIYFLRTLKNKLEKVKR